MVKKDSIDTKIKPINGSIYCKFDINWTFFFQRIVVIFCKRKKTQNFRWFDRKMFHKILPFLTHFDVICVCLLVGKKKKKIFCCVTRAVCWVPTSSMGHNRRSFSYPVSKQRVKVKQLPNQIVNFRLSFLSTFCLHILCDFFFVVVHFLYLEPYVWFRKTLFNFFCIFHLRWKGFFFWLIFAIIKKSILLKIGRFGKRKINEKINFHQNLT